MKWFSFYLLLVALVAMWSGVSSAIKEDSIILYLPFDDKKDVTKDSSGNGNDGKLMGNPKWAEGKAGNAIEMDGNDYITVAQKPLKWEKEFTVCGWFYFAGNFARNNNLFDNRKPGSWSDGGFNLWATDKGRNCGIVFSGPSGYMMTKEGIKEAEKWYHLACMGDAKGGKIYLDGEEIKELQNGAASDANSDQPLIIGQRADLIDGLFGLAERNLKMAAEVKLPRILIFAISELKNRPTLKRFKTFSRLANRRNCDE